MGCDVVQSIWYSRFAVIALHVSHPNCTSPELLLHVSQWLSYIQTICSWPFCFILTCFKRGWFLDILCMVGVCARRCRGIWRDGPEGGVGHSRCLCRFALSSNCINTQDVFLTFENQSNCFHLLFPCRCGFVDPSIVVFLAKMRSSAKRRSLFISLGRGSKSEWWQCFLLFTKIFLIHIVL